MAAPGLGPAAAAGSSLQPCCGQSAADLPMRATRRRPLVAEHRHQLHDRLAQGIDRLGWPAASLRRVRCGIAKQSVAAVETEFRPATSGFAIASLWTSSVRRRAPRGWRTARGPVLSSPLAVAASAIGSTVALRSGSRKLERRCNSSGRASPRLPLPDSPSNATWPWLSDSSFWKSLNT